jgi:hypothetical protein
MRKIIAHLCSRLRLIIFSPTPDHPSGIIASLPSIGTRKAHAIRNTGGFRSLLVRRLASIEQYHRLFNGAIIVRERSADNLDSAHTGTSIPRFIRPNRFRQHTQTDNYLERLAGIEPAHTRKGAATRQASEEQGNPCGLPLAHACSQSYRFQRLASSARAFSRFSASAASALRFAAARSASIACHLGALMSVRTMTGFKG